MKLPIHNTAGLAFLAGIALSAPAFAVVSIDYVTVGNAGNAADVQSQGTFGAVAYAYQIGKNEVPISQYAEFLNNAAKTDTNGLWNSSMGTDLNIAGITRAGNSGAPMLCRRSSMPLRPICSCSHKETINSVPDGP